MLKVIAAFLAPFVLSFFFILYNLLGMILSNDPLTFSFGGFSFVYIFALPAFLFIAVPASFIIERVNKGVRWLNYILAGIIGGGIVIFINTVNSNQDFVYTPDAIVAYMLAGFSFYLTILILEILEQKFQNNEDN
ncbi:hypothetical protein NSA56_18015 [Oceanobacillus caeni]|uniref:Uncharacterized protein n=1 Tax=Oceanobacillus caeni TaxID=405946 RepID=A0ABR5MMV6_9BACI|nr:MULTISPECIES: hypothetical protein [Bacillaceae]KKE79455.1 hypothetical protein WH51_07225 [Bacilli bacterium VT-13-104]PZD81419.1 hypothetical protein DEJ64_17395 [Bacilli bacterium]KPH77628.1 hypothetical protein AFL42_03275 [Oceanobacillus caeni]MBU8792533.1 hypothetical protein [Oceanobacillus caeni]MCR1836229.1 hypothetical protein [Oceanobacillus caeni]